jgi:hypothetical protein
LIFGGSLSQTVLPMILGQAVGLLALFMYASAARRVRYAGAADVWGGLLLLSCA